ncbi:DUF5602 domain-containing protein [Coleofasciculus sp. F4-SAH-05]|uniref:DUF5602 domain-containing protein n=1 Tax=Coleofasciculus sp. F4-SAH-05 TaxID=3069525 RepID=UPI0032FAA49A
MATVRNLLVAPLGAALVALGTVNAVQAATLYGETEPLGDGFIRSFVELDNDGKPSEIGVAFSQGALSLPTEPPDLPFNVFLPPEASATPFNYIHVTYRPRGYPGLPPVFDVPRFSIDFSLLRPQERELICPNPDRSGSLPACVGEELQQAIKTPESGTVPDGMVTDSFGEAGYGVRYFDPDTSLNPFTSFYEYGFFGGKLSSLDVIVTKAFLETQPDSRYQIKLPKSYSKSGYYPTEYRISYDATSQEYKVGYSGLTFRSSTSVPERSPIWGLLVLGTWRVIFMLKNKQQKQKLASRG